MTKLTREVVKRAAVTAGEVLVAALWTVGFTELTIEAVELAVITAASAGLSVLYNAVVTPAARKVRVLRRERDRQRAEVQRQAVIPDEPWGRAAGRSGDELPAEDPGPILDMSAGTRQPRRPWRRT